MISSVFKNEGKVREKELYSLSKGMYHLLKGKIELTDSLSIIAVNYRGEFQKKIRRTKRKIESGSSVSKAFESITGDKEFLELVKIGEEIGNLEAVFKNLYKKYEFRQKLRKNIRNLSIYPISVTITAVIIITVLLKFVIPKFAQIYSDIGQELPKPTKIIINLSKMLDSYSLIFFAVIILIIVFLLLTFRNNKILIEKIALKVPIVKEIYKDICILNFTQNMSSLTSGEIPLVTALKLCKDSKNILLNEEVKKVELKLEKGETLLRAFSNLKFFNEEYRGFLTIGEKTGEISLTFENLKDIYYERVKERTEIFLKILEPASIIFLGIVIGGIVFSVMLPIFKLGEML